VFVVSDDGPGLAAAARAATVHPESAGAGLEVGIAREIVKRHGGTLTARSRPEGGAEFTVRLPRPSHQGPPRKPPSGSGGANGPAGRETVARR
jgi:two-component system sensor histidine kinase MtrB